MPCRELAVAEPSNSPERLVFIKGNLSPDEAINFDDEAFDGQSAVDAVDRLLDYSESKATGAYTSAHEEIVRYAWGQQDLYPGDSGKQVRTGIIDVALAELVSLDLAIESAARQELDPKLTLDSSVPGATCATMSHTDTISHTVIFSNAVLGPALY